MTTVTIFATRHEATPPSPADERLFRIADTDPSAGLCLPTVRKSLHERNAARAPRILESTVQPPHSSPRMAQRSSQVTCGDPT